MEDSPSSMDWQQDTPPPVYIAPARPFRTSPAAQKRSFENYAEDIEAPQGPEAVEDFRYTYASEDRVDAPSPGPLYSHTDGRMGADDIHANTQLNGYWQSDHAFDGHVRPQQWPTTAFLDDRNDRVRPDFHTHVRSQEPTAAAARPVIYPSNDPLDIQPANNIAAGSVYAFQQIKNLATTTTQRARQVKNMAMTTVSTLRHGAARARRFAQRNRRRAYDVYTCAVQVAQAAKRHCLQFTVSRREPVSVGQRLVTPPATPQRTPRRSPPRFTSGRINAENDAMAKEAAASIETNDWAYFLPAPSTADLQLQKVYEMGEDDFMDNDDFMEETKSVNMNDNVQNSPLPEKSTIYSPEVISPAQTTRNSPATLSSAESAASSPVAVSPIQPLRCWGSTFSFAIPTGDSTVTTSPVRPTTCSPTTFSFAASTTDLPVTVSDVSLSELYSPVAVSSARKSPSPPAYKKRSVGIARHFQKTPKKSVGFFVSPRTGAPVSRMKKYIKDEPIDFAVDLTSGTPTTISSYSSSFLRQLEPFGSPVILEDTKAENSSELGTHQPSDLAGHVDNTTEGPRDIRSFGNPTSLEEPEANVNENRNVSEHDGRAVTPHHDILRPIQNCETVIAHPQSPTILVVTELGSPIKAGSTSLATCLGEPVPFETEALTSPKQHDGVSNKENESPSATPVNGSQQPNEQIVVQSSPRLEQPVDQPTTPARHHADQGAAQREQPPDGPVTPVGLNQEFAALNVSGRRTSTRQQLRREAENQRKAEQAAKEAEENARRERAEEEARKQAKEERRKKLTRRIPTEKVVQPVSSEWEDKVAQTMALTDGQEVATTSTGTKLFRRDLGTLLPQAGRDSASGWLNDEIIAAYLQAVVDHGLATTGFKKGQTPKYYAFNTFFYKNIREKGPESVRRWATKAKIGGKNLENVERILIPVHEGLHWTLLVISPVLKTIEYFDSLGGPPHRYVNNAKAWLAQEMGRAWNEADWEVVDSSSPQQNNSKDCGVFTVTTAKMVVLGVDPTAYGSQDIPLQRKRMVAELMHGGFTGEFEPRF